MIKAIVFDLWRTLIPATVDFVHLASLLKKQDISVTDFIARYEKATQLTRHKDFAELRRDFFKEFSQSDNELLEQELYEVYTNRIDKIRFFPEVVEVLKKLKSEGYKVALLSNTEDLIAPVLEKNIKLSTHFDIFAPSYEIGAIKPDKRAFDFVLAKLKLKPSEVLMVGDSLRSDIVGAQKAGWHNCLINRSGKILDGAKVKPDFEIKSLDELSRVLGVLNATRK